MYCQKCGCKINMEERRCSDCGTDVKGNEYCGGFWGLVGEEEKVRTFTPQGENSKEELEKDRTIRKYKSLKLFLVEVVLILILMVVCLLQFVQISQISKQFDKLYQVCEELGGDYQELNDKYTEIKEQVEELSILEAEENPLLEEDSVSTNNLDRQFNQSESEEVINE